MYKVYSNQSDFELLVVRSLREKIDLACHLDYLEGFVVRIQKRHESWRLSGFMKVLIGLVVWSFFSSSMLGRTNTVLSNL